MLELSWIDYCCYILLFVLLLMQVYNTIQQVNKTNPKASWVFAGMVMMHVIGFFAYNYFISTFEYKNDLLSFYERNMSPRQWLFHSEIVGTKFFYAIHYPFVQLGFHYFTVSAIGAFISLQGYIWLYKYYFIENSFRIAWNMPSLLILYLLLSPNLHFWTASGLGKDALLFVAYVVVALQLCRSVKFTYAIVPWLLFIFMIRPHSGLITCFVLFLCFILSSNYGRWTKAVALIGSAGIIGIVGYIFITAILKINDFSAEGLERLISVINQSVSGGAHTQLVEMSYVNRCLQLMFGPTIFNWEKNIFIIAAIENTTTFVLIVMSMIILLRDKLLLREHAYYQYFLIFSALSIWISISLYILNWGWAMRAKTSIVLFVFMYLIDRSISFRKQRIDTL